MEKKLPEITLNAYAKINLSLEVTGRRSDGYHDIESLMQGIDLFDVIKITKCAENGTKYNLPHCTICGVVVYLCTDTETIPTDMSNLALKGIKSVLEELQAQDHLTKDVHKTELPESLLITIDKKLPVAAGIAGGSGNGAACMLGINALMDYPFTLRELMRIGVNVGADVPFSLMMNAKRNSASLAGMEGISEASTAAWISGIGENVEPQAPLLRYIVMANPGISVSTRDAYEAIDSIRESERDHTDEAADQGAHASEDTETAAGSAPAAQTVSCVCTAAEKTGSGTVSAAIDISKAGAEDGSGCGQRRLFRNDFEDYVFDAYPEAVRLRQLMTENLSAEKILMSGSGPTMIAYYTDADKASADHDKLQSLATGEKNWRVWQTVTGDE